MAVRSLQIRAKVHLHLSSAWTSKHQVWLSAARGLQRRSRAVGPERGRGRRPRSSLVWTRPGAVRTLGFARYGAGFALPVQGLRQDLQRAERYAVSGLHHKERWLSFGASLANRRCRSCDVASASPVLASARILEADAVGIRGEVRQAQKRDHHGWCSHGGGCAAKVHGVLDPVVAKDALLVSDELPTLAAALGVSQRSAQPLWMGERAGRCMCRR